LQEASLSELEKKTGILKRTLINNLKKLIELNLIKKIGSKTSPFYQRVIIPQYIPKSITVFKEAKRFGNLYFGDDGYFKIERNKNTCGISLDVSSAILK
jgi:DNA-binding HxlR family transcriptional regulator